MRLYSLFIAIVIGVAAQTLAIAKLCTDVSGTYVYSGLSPECTGGYEGQYYFPASHDTMGVLIKPGQNVTLRQEGCHKLSISLDGGPETQVLKGAIFGPGKIRYAEREVGVTDIYLAPTYSSYKFQLSVDEAGTLQIRHMMHEGCSVLPSSWFKVDKDKCFFLRVR